MHPTQHPSNNDVLAAPESMSHDECRSLAITRVQYAGAGLGVVSYWQPTAAQIALLNAGRPVWLSVMGMTHPPVMLGVDGDGALDFERKAP